MKFDVTVGKMQLNLRALGNSTEQINRNSV